MIELYRAMIPSNYIINDNHGQHYKVHMGCLDFLTKQFERILNNEEEAPGNFKIPSINELSNYLGIDINLENNVLSYDNDKYPLIDIICEVWRPIHRRFDPQNYAKTFKAPIDLLTKYGYIIDDNWQYINSITYKGGGPSVWDKRHFAYNNDNLPKELDINWWNSYSDYTGDIFIRIMINKVNKF